MHCVGVESHLWIAAVDPCALCRLAIDSHNVIDVSGGLERLDWTKRLGDAGIAGDFRIIPDIVEITHSVLSLDVEDCYRRLRQHSTAGGPNGYGNYSFPFSNHDFRSFCFSESGFDASICGSTTTLSRSSLVK